MTSEALQKAGLQEIQRHHLDLSTLPRQKAMQRVIEMLFGEAVRRMVAAFEKRAGDLYGGPALAGVAAPAC